GCVAPANAQPACIAGTCEFVCRTGFDECSGSCVDTQTDVNNCGSCGTKCDAGDGAPTCEAGKCTVACETGLSACGSECVDFEKDEENCGACGNSCVLGPCLDGECLLL